MSQQYSDSTQLASIRVAKEAIDRNHGLSLNEREYHKRVLDCIASRIDDAARKRREKQQEARGK